MTSIVADADEGSAVAVLTGMAADVATAAHEEEEEGDDGDGGFGFGDDEDASIEDVVAAAEACEGFGDRAEDDEMLDEDGIPMAQALPVAAAADAGDLMMLEDIDMEGYEDIPLNMATPADIPDGCKPLNRYINILPNPRTRVPLAQVGPDPTTTYINANYIRGHQGQANTYICTQGPMPNLRSTADFWRMVWQEKSTAILMVTGITERGTEKCARYWPNALYNEKLKSGGMNHAGIVVRVIAGFRKDGYITSRIALVKGGEQREVRHYWFDSWPDHGVPERTEPVISMLQAVQEWAPLGGAPWVVHCSAGIGRSGTIVAVDMGMRMMVETGRANVIDIITELRQDRGGMVQHKEQAEFVHLCLGRYTAARGKVDALQVLELSLRRAEEAVPDGFTVHASQLDTDEGAADAVPSWRKQQLADLEEADKEGEVEEVQELRADSASLAERRAKRLQEKREAKARAAQRAAALLTSSGSIRKSTKKPVASGIATRSRASANPNHASIKFGRMNPNAYATLDGDFHMNSNGKASEE